MRKFAVLSILTAFALSIVSCSSGYQGERKKGKKMSPNQRSRAQVERVSR